MPLSWTRIEELRRADWSWPQISEVDGRAPSTLRSIASRKGSTSPGAPEEPADGFCEKDVSDSVTRSGVTTERITSLADLYDFFEIPYRWEEGRHGEPVPVSDDYEVVSVRVNSWEQHSVKKGFQTLYQVRATLRPKQEVESREIIERVWNDLKEDAARYTPRSDRGPLSPPEREGGQLLEIFLADPHIGMLAWGEEVGENYDLSIAVQDYRRAFRSTLGMAALYPNIDRVLYVVGNDLFHVDAPGMNATGGATTRGTAQDLDTRLNKLFRTVRRMVVECVDDALEVGCQVDVLFVPGNHDRYTVFKAGEVLEAWYRHQPAVNVINTPQLHDFYRYGTNLFMFTHGEIYKRLHPNLATVFATECPPDLWAGADVREVHLGHWHANFQKVWQPTGEVTESRAIRARALPGLTPSDNWHVEQGYKHLRRGTVMVWNAEGGLAGLHEQIIRGST